MTPLAALAFYPLLSVALAIGLTALRLGRQTRGGLVLLCAALALWVTGLILLASGASAAERVLPMGMLLAGAVVHAGLDVAGTRAPRILAAGYGYGAAVTLVGLLAPRLLYGEGAHGTGPLFWPLAVTSSLGTLAVVVMLTGLARAAEGAARRRRFAVVLAAVLGAVGGGGMMVLRVFDLGGPYLAAPMLLLAIALTGYAVFSGEEGRGRELLVAGAVQTLLTAVLSAAGLSAFYRLLPNLLPDRGAGWGWLVLVVFFAALPLDPFRMLVVERTSRVLFRKPTTLPDLAQAVHVSEARADQAERLAELGRVVSAVAHEMRNPLGVISAQAKLLERRGAPPETIEALRAQVERARHFLDDLLRYGKPRPLDVRDFDAALAIELGVSSARQAFGEDAPEVYIEAAAAGRIEADRSAFLDVVTALVANACIAASAAAGGKVRVRAEDEGDHLCVVVEDDGPGVPRELEATLFQPFVTGRGRDARHPGTGLGLAIAARWLERHGGTLHHERPSGDGARFVAKWRRR